MQDLSTETDMAPSRVLGVYDHLFSSSQTSGDAGCRHARYSALKLIAKCLHQKHVGGKHVKPQVWLFSLIICASRPTAAPAS